MPYFHSCGMIFHMKTTLIIDDRLMARIKSFAADQRSTLSKMVETLLRRGLEKSETGPGKLKELPTFKCGRAKIDISDRNELYDFFDNEKK